MGASHHLNRRRLLVLSPPVQTYVDGQRCLQAAAEPKRERREEEQEEGEKGREKGRKRSSAGTREIGERNGERKKEETRNAQNSHGCHT